MTKSINEISPLRVNGLNEGLRVKPKYKKAFECHFADFMLFFRRAPHERKNESEADAVQGSASRKSKYDVAVVEQKSLLGQVILSPVEDAQAPLLKGLHFQSTHILANHINSVIGDIFERFINGQKQPDTKAIMKFAKSLETDASLMRLGIAKTARLIGELIAGAASGQISSVSDFREVGIRIIKKICVEHDYTRDEKRLVRFISENKDEFRQLGLARLCAKYPEKIPQDYVNDAASHIHHITVNEIMALGEQRGAKITACVSRVGGRG